MKVPVAAAAAATAVVAGAQLLPSVGTIPAVHKLLLPRLSGVADNSHVALTFDDGPDPASTPEFLDTLARLDVRATFFVLGTQLQHAPGLARRAVADGHELAVHGWQHRPHLLRAPWRVPADIAATRDRIVDVTGEVPRFWRPPNGILSGAGLLAARRLGLQPVLWTADGCDWSPTATAASVRSRIDGRLRGGGTVLLHDSDITSATGSWQVALAALPGLVAGWRERGWQIGPLRDHWPEAGART